MMPTLKPVDREVVQNSFREWQAEQTLLDAQLNDSLAALEAYQSHLDTWQQELAREREELRQLRAAIERDQAGTGAQREQLEQLSAQLADARQRAASLTDGLLERTEELRTLDRERGDALRELSAAQTREKELAASLAALRESHDAERQQWEAETAQLQADLQQAISSAAGSGNSTEPARNGHAKPAARSESPVLGTVMEQFGKLRAQRSVNRPNSKLR